jgi:hypothetical protein
VKFSLSQFVHLSKTRLGTGSSPFCLSVKRMGFLLTLEYCERAGRGQASLSLSLNSPTPLFILCTSVWVVGVFPACAAGGRPQQPETPPRGGEAGREPARSQAGPLWGGEGNRTGSELPRSCRPPVRAQKAGSSAQPAPQLRAAGGALLPRRARWRGPSAARSSPAVPGLRGGASPMAEGRRREDEEEELRERRELGGPRRARSRALPGHSAAGETRGTRGPGAHGGLGASRTGFSAPTHALPSSAAALDAAWRGLTPLTPDGERAGQWPFYP